MVSLGGSCQSLGGACLGQPVRLGAPSRGYLADFSQMILLVTP